MPNRADKHNENLSPRPPIVVVMGHVDHGKTALLDYFRKTNVVAREAGGITQSIGAYEIVHNGKKITFVDTPGHEAFREMRSRGATVADLAILVVAADESVKPQTIEAFNILKESQTPFVVAITKVDKPAANVEKVKGELMAQGIALEGYGGDISWQAVSVITGEGAADLLDLILLMGEVLGLTYDAQARGKGVVIEVLKDSRRGVVAHLVLRDGLLKEGDYIVTKTATGKIKMLENFSGERVKELAPSAPASVLGFEDLPLVGEEFTAGFVNLAEIGVELEKERTLAREKLTAQGELSAIDESSHKVITKADTSGSLEVLNQVIGALAGVVIVDSSLGDVSDGDVDQALGTGSLIVSFNVKIKPTAENRARTNQVQIFSSDIIYKLVEGLEEYVAGKRAKEVLGELEILKIFETEKNRIVLGGRVVSGAIKNGAPVGFERRGALIGEGKILNLQENRKDVSEVGEGKECGMLIETGTKLSAGDRLKIFQ